MAYVNKHTPWSLCAPCKYCGAAEGYPCLDMNRRKARTCHYPHQTRTLIDLERTEVPNIPLTPTTAERLTKLEAEQVSDRMQLRAALQAILTLTETVEDLKAERADLTAAVEDLRDNNSYLIRMVQNHKDTVDRLFKEQLLHKAVQLVMAFEDDPDEPTFEDYWDLDQSKTDLHLTYRVEEVIL